MDAPVFPFILYPALRSLLVNKLQKHLNFQDISLHQQTSRIDLSKLAAEAAQIAPLGLLEIPLNRVKSKTQVEYVSALAIKLANQSSQRPSLQHPSSQHPSSQHPSQLSALVLAQQMVTYLSDFPLVHPPDEHLSEPLDKTIDKTMDRIWQNFDLSVANSGWIHFRLTDSGLAAWLQCLISTPLSTPRHLEEQPLPYGARRPRKTNSTDRHSFPVFAVYHSHARCCTLLQMASREGLISLVQTQSHLGSDFSIAQPLPWLNAEQRLRCRQSQERDLIGQISDALDYLSQPTLSHATDSLLALKTAANLSQAFQHFHAACRIWGEVKQQDRPLAQARLGLVLITQRVLRWLLEHRLDLPAPIDL